jgi:tRNA (guanine10-N2)-dimethyltransferase
MGGRLVKLLVALTGLHASMPESEALGAVPCLVLDRVGRVLVLESAFPDALARLGYAAAVLEFLGEGSLRELPFEADGVVTGPYRVRVTGAGAGARPHGVERALQDLLWHALSDPHVDLRRPSLDLYAFVAGERVLWGRLLHDVRAADFEARANHRLPFVRSYVTPPRKARALVNMSGIEPGQRLLDPCCGAGGYLIEAALMGAHAFGSDVDERAVNGTSLNLRELGLEAELRTLDARHLEAWGRTFDAVVTDIPYGHSASLRGLDRGELVGGLLRSAALVLARGGIAVLMAPHGAVQVPADLFVLLERHLEPVHASLTREIVVLCRR